jgi:pentatricopeptide repeat protein
MVVKFPHEMIRRNQALISAVACGTSQAHDRASALLVFNTAIHAASAAGEWRQALSFLSDMQVGQRFAPSPFPL